MGAARRDVGALALLLLLACGTLSPALAEGWTVQVTASGQATGTKNYTPMFQQTASSMYGGQNVPVTISGNSGNAAIAVSAGTGPQDNNPSATGASSGTQVTVTLTWQPKNGDWALDPAPNVVCIGLTRNIQAQAYAYASAIGAQGTLTASSSATVSLAGLTATTRNLSVSATQHAAPPVTNTDTDNVPLVDLFPIADYVSVVSGVATRTYSLNWSMNATCDDPVQSPSGSSANASINWSLGITPGYVDIARSNGRGGVFDGSVQGRAGDPTFTRWLPLMYSPVVSSQPVRNQSGALPAPWGNVNCLYSINLHREKNADVNSAFLRYLAPSGPPPQTLSNTKTSNPSYVITDSNGNRLTYDSSFVRNDDIYSDLVAITGGYELRNAGPPGAIATRGIYTYRFEALPSSNPTDYTPARLVAILDDKGNQQTLTWGTGLTVTDSSSGRQMVFTAGTGSYFTTVDAPGSPGTRTTVSYDSSGHATQIQVFLSTGGAAVHSDVFGYSGDTLISVQQSGGMEAYTYVSTGAPDALGSLIQRVATASYGSSSDTTSSDTGTAILGVYNYSYGTQSNRYGGVDARKNTVTDPRGNVWTQTWTDVNGALHTTTYSGPTFTGAPAANQATVNYTPDITRPTNVSITDALSRLWQVNLDSNGNVTQSTDPLSNSMFFGWSPDGKYLTSITDPTSLLWQFGYTGNRVSSITDPGNAVRMTAIYNTYGQPTSITTPAAVSASGTAETNTFTYDATKGDLTKATGPLGDAVTINSYDALGDPLSFSLYPDTGNPTTSTTPLTMLFNYDAAQAPLTITLPSGVVMSPTINNGVMTQLAATKLGTTVGSLAFSYDTRSRPYSASDSVGSVAQVRFDKNSNVTKVLDGRGNTTTVAYGPANEPTGVTWPGGAGQSYSYDAAGRIRQVVDERAITRNYIYDNADRLTDIQFPAYSAQNLHYTYDAAGRTTSITDATGSTTFSYDAVRKRVSSITVVLGGRSYVLSYNYYGDGTLQSVITPVGTTSYTYNANGLAASMTSPFGEVTTWTADHTGRLTNETTTTTASKTLSTSYTYGVSGQAADTSTAPAYLRTITQSVAGAAFETYTLKHTYTGKLEQQSGTGTFNETLGYGYDGRGRVTSDSNSITTGGTTYSSSGTYQFDLADNLQGGTGGWTYNSNNQPTTTFAMGGLPATTGLAYDNAGNMTTANGMTFSYDAGGNVTSITGTASGTVTYTYNFAGQRVSKTVGGVTTYYLYDGALLIAEIDGATGAILKSYHWGALGLLSERVSGASRYYLYDRSGNTRAIVDANGTVLSRGGYTAWGTPIGALSPNTSFGWNGRWGAYRDSETGLILMGARYYAPALGRFITRDPSSFAGGINLYGYCAGDPVNCFDTDGHLLHILGGALLGGLIQGGIEGYISYRHGHGFWPAAGKGFVKGAITGALVTAIGPGGLLGEAGAFGGMNCIRAGMAYGSLGGFTNNLVGQGLNLADGTQQKFNPWSLAQDTAMGAVTGGLFNKLFRLCFVAGTPVQMADGTVKPIEKIKAGDIVLSRDQFGSADGKVTKCKVLRTSKRNAPVVVKVRLAEVHTGRIVETITASRDHPFYVRGKGFVPAGGLAIGNAIVTRAGPEAVVAKVEWLRKSGGFTVYNFEVEKDHTYFVGKTSGGAWVHNGEGDCVVRAVNAAKRYGGTSVGGTNYRFPTRQAARQAASEIAGNLGSEPITERLKDFWGLTSTWRTRLSNNVTGRMSSDGAVKWVDHFLGHLFPDGSRVGGHVNVYMEGHNFHLWY